MPTKLVEGVYAALLTPRSENGSINESAFLRLLGFLLEKGIRGFVLNGATGEFCLTTPAELEQLAALIVKTIGPERQFICGIGSASVEHSSQLASLAAEYRAAAVLLPPPYFFPYQQEDVKAFLSVVADRSPLPVLLYNLPYFTSSIEVHTTVELLGEHANIIGIKDSSGSLDILEAVTKCCPAACRIVGSDGALIEARERALCDAVVSGVACVLPELITSIFDRSPRYAADCDSLNEFLERAALFPTPWALKWIAEARGLAPACFAQPLSPTRVAQGRELQRWFRQIS